MDSLRVSHPRDRAWSHQRDRRWAYSLMRETTRYHPRDRVVSLMRPHEAIEAARVAGKELTADGDDLGWSAASAPPAEILDALFQHGAEIVALLRPGRDAWSREEAWVISEGE